MFYQCSNDKSQSSHHFPGFLPKVAQHLSLPCWHSPVLSGLAASLHGIFPQIKIRTPPGQVLGEYLKYIIASFLITVVLYKMEKFFNLERILEIHRTSSALKICMPCAYINQNGEAWGVLHGSSDDLELRAILLPLPQESWDNSHESLYTALWCHKRNRKMYFLFIAIWNRL